MMKLTTLALATVVAASRLGAQVPAPVARKVPTPAATAEMKAQPPGGDPIMRCLFPPELVMAHQQEIGLQDAQRTKLITEMSQAQAKFTEVQWTLSAEQQKLEQVLKSSTVDEVQALKEVDSILALEHDLKSAQMTLMVRVKNTLTPQQQETLAAMRPRGYDWSTGPARPDGPQ